MIYFGNASHIRIILSAGEAPQGGGCCPAIKTCGWGRFGDSVISRESWFWHKTISLPFSTPSSIFCCLGDKFHPKKRLHQCFGSSVSSYYVMKIGFLRRGVDTQSFYFWQYVVKSSTIPRGCLIHHTGCRADGPQQVEAQVCNKLWHREGVGAVVLMNYVLVPHDTEQVLFSPREHTVKPGSKCTSLKTVRHVRARSHTRNIE